MLASRLNTQQVDGLLLEELVPAELESALDEVAREGGAHAGKQGTGAFVGDDGAEGVDSAFVVLGWVELDACFDA